MKETVERELGFQVELVREGLARVLIPKMDLYLREDKVYEPAWAPVFYNPRMRFNRDIAILFTRVYSVHRKNTRKERAPVIVEPLAGTGVRAVRYALEAGAQVVANDIDSTAAKLIELNARINNVSDRLQVFQLDANELLSGLKRKGMHPDIVDIDPFGSPAPYLDAAIQSLGWRGVLALTATDTAPLTGSHLRALKRRYDVEPARTAWEKEQAVRILVGYVIRRAASYGYGTRILLAYYADYYVRVYVELLKGAKRADQSLDTLGYGSYCPGCGYTGYINKHTTRCPYCGHELQRVGPIYTGPLCDKEMLDHLLREAHRSAWLAEHKRVISFLEAYREECEITKPYYRIDRVCSILRRNMPKISQIVNKLKAHGHKAVRSTYDPRAVKTTAKHSEFLKVLSEL